MMIKNKKAIICLISSYNLRLHIFFSRIWITLTWSARNIMSKMQPEGIFPIQMTVSYTTISVSHKWWLKNLDSRLSKSCQTEEYGFNKRMMDFESWERPLGSEFGYLKHNHVFRCFWNWIISYRRFPFSAGRRFIHVKSWRDSRKSQIRDPWGT